MLTFALPCVTLAGERTPAPVLQTPTNKPLAFKPREQTDGHSCGYLALASLYESYGVNPEQARLRQRLGTDSKAVPFSSESIGTIQPDILRVLKQDGFHAELLKLSNEYSKDRLIVHLQSDQYSLALIKRKENSNLHWVALIDFDKGELTVGDSLRDKLYQEPIAEFAATNILSVILINPSTPDPNGKYGGEHRRGVWEMIKTWWRG